MDSEERLLSAKDVAKLLSCNVSTVWAYLKAGHIPKPVYLGCSTRWKMSDMQKFIAGLQPAEELKKAA